MKYIPANLCELIWFKNQILPHKYWLARVEHCQSKCQLWRFFSHFRPGWDAETLSQHFSQKVGLAEAQALSGYMIYNLSLLMSRQSVRVCCVFAHMFFVRVQPVRVSVGVGVCVLTVFGVILPKHSLKKIKKWHFKSCVLGRDFFFCTMFSTWTLLPAVLRWSWQRCYHGFGRYHRDGTRPEVESVVVWRLPLERTQTILMHYCFYVRRIVLDVVFRALEWSSTCINKRIMAATGRCKHLDS